jgi:serine/threonine protein kinase
MLDKKYDTQIDMWSVGCIFYELLNFQGKVKS